MRIIATVLAAGQADRFGSNKQLALVGGRPMINRVCSAVSDAAPDAVVLVAGRDALDVHAAAGTPYLVINERFAEGIGSSIATAANAFRHTADAIMICLGDQPLVPGEHYAALIDAWNGDPDRIIATSYAGTIGVPALFGSRHFDALGRLSGDKGAKAVFAAAGERLAVIPCEEAGVDVDTAADLDKLNQPP